MATFLISADMAISYPCVVFALRRESMYFRRAYPYPQRFPGAPCRAEFRGPTSRCRESSGTCGPARLAGPTAQSVLMLETGVGESAMETAVRWCLSAPRFGSISYRPRFLVSVGFSGALQPEQRVGDLVLATEVVDQQGNRWPAVNPAPSLSREITVGRVLSVPDLVDDPREKERLGQQHDAVAVDMESAIAARLCQQNDIPFVCLRVISDDRNTALSPHLVALLRRGRVSILRLAGTVLHHPGLIAELWRLAGNTRRAARGLLAVRSLLHADGAK